jgi:ribosomal protein S18 acetylase RimI-like enzyme
MPSESPSQAGLSDVAIRPFSAEDQPFLAQVAPRMHPGQTASPRDPATLDRFFSDLGDGNFLSKPGAQAFVATIDGQSCGVISFYPDRDYFTDHPRAYVDNLAVAQESEGKGVGRALLDYVERWARDHGYREVVLDVFAGNQRAIAFYERQGYRPDHIRMAKPLD